jgi:glutathione S-transferase
MEPIAVVTLLALVEYFFFSAQVARARGKAGLKAPAVVGDAIFERHFRVQQNTLEQLVIFLPSLWLFGLYVHAPTGAAIGLIFIVGRFVYYRAYVADPGKRGTGFLIGEVAQGVLLVGALIGAVISWI